MSNFFSEVLSAEGKKKYQRYKIELLSEEFNVLVPFVDKDKFYEHISKIHPTTRQDVITTLKEFNGRLA